MGALTKGSKKAAREQAAATLAVADDQKKYDLEIARATQMSRETAIAQDKAVQKANELVKQNPVEQVEVTLADGEGDAEVDPDTGRRRTPRAAFMSRSAAGSGIRI